MSTSDDDDDNDIDDDNVYNQKDQCVIKALGGQNMTVCPIVVVPSQALRTGGESPFSGGTMFFSMTAVGIIMQRVFFKV